MAYPKNPIYHETLVGDNPKQWLLHGPTKLLLSTYHYHSPNVGVVASYTPKERDVKDHFGIFRGVDQIESFALATIASCGTYSQCKKQNCKPIDLRDDFVPVFTNVGSVTFHNYLEKGQTFINIGHIKRYKFRQMICDGRIYRVPPGFDLDEYFKNFTDERLLAYDLPKEFKLIAELFEVTGQAIKKEIFNSL